MEFSRLADNFKEALDEVRDWGAPPTPPKQKDAKPALQAALPTEPILIEDLESGENLQPTAVEHAASGSAAPADPMAAGEMNLALLQAFRKKRNKGWKRVQALAERISEKKMRGQWQEPDVPVPNFAAEYLKPATEKIQDKVWPGREWTK